MKYESITGAREHNKAVVKKLHWPCYEKMKKAVEESFFRYFFLFYFFYLLIRIYVTIKVQLMI
jgi:hypothetical protein